MSPQIAWLGWAAIAKVPDMGTVAGAVATVALAAVTFLSVRVAKQQFGRQLLPVLIPSRVREPRRDALFPDGFRKELRSDEVFVSLGGPLYLAIPLRNIGSGIAVLKGLAVAGTPVERAPAKPPGLKGFLASRTDLYLAPGDVSHLAFYSEAADSWLEGQLSRIESLGPREEICLDILYSDHARGQESITRIALARSWTSANPADGDRFEAAYLTRAIKHWRPWRRPRRLPAFLKREWQRSFEAAERQSSNG